MLQIAGGSGGFVGRSGGVPGGNEEKVSRIASGSALGPRERAVARDLSTLLSQNASGTPRSTCQLAQILCGRPDFDDPPDTCPHQDHRTP